MACGTPVVCSRTSSLPEVVGDAAALIDPLNALDIADALSRLLRDESYAGDLRRRGLARAATFTWEQTAERTVAVYQAALAN